MYARHHGVDSRSHSHLLLRLKSTFCSWVRHETLCWPGHEPPWILSLAVDRIQNGVGLLCCALTSFVCVSRRGLLSHSLIVAGSKYRYIPHFVVIVCTTLYAYAPQARIKLHISILYIMPNSQPHNAFTSALCTESAHGLLLHMIRIFTDASLNQASKDGGTWHCIVYRRYYYLCSLAKTFTGRIRRGDKGWTLAQLSAPQSFR